MENTANIEKTKPHSKHAATVCPHCQKAMTSKNMARHLRLVHGDKAKAPEAPTTNIKASLENAATNTDNVSISAEEHITIRQQLDTAKQAIAAVEALLHQKQRALTARIASIGPQVPVTY